MKLPILCVDFDGVIHSYVSGWQGVDKIPDPPVQGAIAFLREAVNHFTVAVYSSRSGEVIGRTAMREWLGYWSVQERTSDQEDLSWTGLLAWPSTKPSALVTLDDRAITFTGVWPEIADLKNFKPWYAVQRP